MKGPIFGTPAGGLFMAIVLACLVGCAAKESKTPTQSPIQQGRDLSVEYCQACHYFEGTDQAGTLGPPLVAMKPRFPERQRLEQIIYDPHKAIKPYSMMPPFGRNGLLDSAQINLVIDYLYTL